MTVQPQRREVAARRAWRALGALIAIGAASALILAGLIMIYGARERARPADVVIVLGAGEAGTSRRAEHAARLYQRGLAPHVLCSGGYRGPDGRREAEVCAAVVRAAGVPAEAIVLEPDSRSTEQNARHAAQIMRARGWRSAVVVSDSFHLLRARWLFSREGVTVWTSPAPRPGGVEGALGTALFLAREVGALAYQAVKIALGV